MAGLSTSVPLVLVVLAASALVVGLAATAVRRRQLDPQVADARRHGAGAGGFALLAGSAAAVLVGLADPAAGLGPGVSVALAPLAFAAVHTAVLWVAESAWPRPRGAVRTASLAPRRFPVPARRMRAVLVLSVAGAAGVAVTGMATAAPDGRSIAGAVHVLPDGLGSVGPSAAGPYPGAVYAAPVLVGLVLLVVLVVLAVRTALTRAAVPGDGSAEVVLRAASVHRILRGASAGVLVELGGLLAFGSLALRSVAHGTAAGVDDRVFVVGGNPLLEVLATVGAAVGGLAALAGIALLAVPAPRLRPVPPAPSGPPPAAVPAGLP
ncbi:hypothetical protein SAMN05660199_03644 [Klenkia soli]|uniref:Uncharacterized protein n=1 Tax=Klenkia soli TaxID=1052260 RepID=A0A1H0RVG0_9ACTN|nr:hypothetical protein [Klenkia soli]SDP33370.1 hypothetical protein SAMN05660199_03644 [Klenkia soli]